MLSPPALGDHAKIYYFGYYPVADNLFLLENGHVNEYKVVPVLN
jgi:hypothetical protein